MAWFREIEQLRGVGNWAVTYHWDIRFIGSQGSTTPPDSPFDDWFPAVSVEEPIFNIETYPINMHILQTEIPKSIGNKTLSMDFLDNEDDTLETWLRDWYSTMTNDELEIATLQECLNIVEVARLDSLKNQLSAMRYYVFPKGNVSVSHNSSGDLKKISVTFGIAGMERVVS